MPMMTRIEKLPPCWSPNPVPVCMAYPPLHETVDRASGWSPVVVVQDVGPLVVGPKMLAALCARCKLWLEVLKRLRDNLQLVATPLGRPGVLLEEVLLSFGQPVSPSLRWLVWWIAVELNHMCLGLIGGPRSEVNVGNLWQWWEVWHLSILLGSSFDVELQL